MHYNQRKAKINANVNPSAHLSNDGRDDVNNKKYGKKII